MSHRPFASCDTSKLKSYVRTGIRLFTPCLSQHQERSWKQAMGDSKRPPRSVIEDTRRQLEDQRQREQEEREPWEQDRSWRETVPGYDLLRARGLPNKLIYRLFQRDRAVALWTRTAAIRLPKSRHRVWSEQSLAIEALSCGLDDGIGEWR